MDQLTPISKESSDMEREFGNLAEGVGNDVIGENLERPTSAPPTLDIYNESLFSFSAFNTTTSPVNGGEKNFSNMSENTFGHNTGNLMSPLSAQSDLGVFGNLQGNPNSLEQDARKRTQSIENFLAQSPGSILARKRFGSVSQKNCSVPGNETAVENTQKQRVQQGIEEETPLSSLRKNLDALNLSVNTEVYGDDSNLRQHLQYQQDLEGFQNAYSMDLPSFMHDSDVSKSSSINHRQIKSATNSPTSNSRYQQSNDPISSSSTPHNFGPPLRSPERHISPLQSPINANRNGTQHHKQQNNHNVNISNNNSDKNSNNFYNAYSSNNYTGGNGNVRGNNGSNDNGGEQMKEQQHMYNDPYYYSNMQGQYLDPYSFDHQQYGEDQTAFMHTSYNMHNSMYENNMMSYYQQQQQQQQHTINVQRDSRLPNERHLNQQHEDKKQQESYMANSGLDSQQNPLVPMQKVILPNGMEAMVVPMMHGMTSRGWDGNGNFQAQPPPPPPSAPPSNSGRGNVGYYNNNGKSNSKNSNNNNNNISNNNSSNNNSSNNSNSKGHNRNAKGKGRKDNSDKHIHIQMTSEGIMPASDQAAVISTSTPLSDFEAQIFKLSKEQNGCRYLQQKVDSNGADAVEFILKEVTGKLVILMLDPFGNYLFQKLLEHATPEQTKSMLDETKDHLLDAALNLHGTRSVQKFIEVCGTNASDNKNRIPVDLKQLSIVIEKLKPHITKMSMDTNGNHVVQRCLQYIPREHIGFVYDIVIRDVLIITRHRHGCCVFQRCIDAASSEQRKPLVEKIIEHAVSLMQDPYGNYVVQYVLEYSKNNEANKIIKQLPGKLTVLSMQKFSSNVVEKCLQYASNNEIEPLIEELCEFEIMRKFLNDQFANYVVQRALMVADDKQGNRLVKAIRPHMIALASNNASCARRVSGKIVTRFPSLINDKLFSNYVKDTSASNDGHGRSRK